jgi:hypothetical protein
VAGTRRIGDRVALMAGGVPMGGREFPLTGFGVPAAAPLIIPSPIGEAQAGAGVIRSQLQRRRRACVRDQPVDRGLLRHSSLLGCAPDLSLQPFTPSDQLSEILFEPGCRGFRLQHPGSRHCCAIIGGRLLFQRPPLRTGFDIGTVVSTLIVSWPRKVPVVDEIGVLRRSVTDIAFNRE